VITGKGSSPFARHTLHGHSHFHTPEREGKLRREVPMWFHDVEFRKHIIGFQPAHPRHGGGGAFYVKLRRTIGDPE
jgi:DNA-nicking Smr family endonuclease